MNIPNKKYRFEIDGLRALAVMAVVLNHLNHDYLPSGFLGVDVFFVISGFVITSSLAGLPKQNFGAFFASFFERRIKRLLPALAVCVALTGIAISFVDPNPIASLRTGMFAIFGLSNFYLLANSTDYFARAAGANAFTQTWSLSVEEQFYLIFPAVVWSSFFLRTGTGASRLAQIIGAVSTVSLVTYITLSYSHPSAAFYLMPTRFWELGAGCLLYLYLHRSGKDYLLAGGQTVSLLAMLGMAVLLTLPGGLTPYSTLAVVILTLTLIASTAPGGTLYRALLNPVVQFVGKISYSLYLWHWSVLCLSRWLIGEQTVAEPFLLTIMFVLATGSYFFVERPMRVSKWAETRSRSIAAGLAGGLTVVVAMAVVGLQHSSFLRTHRTSIEMSAAALPIPGSGLDFGATCIIDGGDRPLRPDTFERCTILPTRAGGQTIWALGDSHAGHLQGLLYEVHQKTGMGVHLIETPGVTFPLNVATFPPREAIFKQILQSARPGDIVLVSRLFIEKSRHEVLSDIPQWSDRAGTLADDLRTHKLNLVVVGPPPIFRFEDLDACNFTVFGLSPCVEDRSRLNERIQLVLDELAEGLRGRAFVFDPFQYLCPAAAARCTPIKAGQFIFRDKDHLNPIGAGSLAVPFLQFLESHRLISADPVRAPS